MKRKRDWKFSMYLTLEEKMMIKRKAERAGLNQSELIRFLVAGYEPKESPPKEFYDALNSIRKVGNLFNKMATKLYYFGYFEDEKWTRKLANDLNNLVLDIRRKYELPEKVK